MTTMRPLRHITYTVRGNQIDIREWRHGVMIKRRVLPFYG